MSYDISVDNGLTGKCRILDEPHFLKGSVYPVEGTHEARFNVTYNYHQIYKLLWKKGIRRFDGKRIEKVKPQLKKAIAKLGTMQCDNYWLATTGNAGKALQNLLELLELCKPGDILRIS